MCITSPLCITGRDVSGATTVGSSVANMLVGHAEGRRQEDRESPCDPAIPHTDLDPDRLKAGIPEHT